MKTSNTKENYSKCKYNSDDELINKLDEHFMVKHNSTILELWQQALKLDGKYPTEAFCELFLLKLVGPFELLNDLMKNKYIQEPDYIVKNRFSTDLPEMETIMTYQGGRFCFWRDEPNEQPEFLVHVSNEPKNFPVFTIVGDQNPFCALAFLLMQKKQSTSNLLPSSFDSSKYNQKFLQSLKNHRTKNSLGKAFHGLGIKVDVNEKEVGYRPVTDDIKRLKRDIELMGTTNSEAEKKTLKEQLFKIYSYVQFANDEMDFGMGLEFGHDLFISNYECFDGMAKSVLSTAYKLLDRNVFATILEKHWEYGRRKNDNKLLTS